MTINTEDITTGTTEGTGIFDVLMQAARVHLQAEFDANRIRGNDYATVYTATIGQAMQVAASYATTKPLADQQVLNAQAEALNIPKQGLLLDKQIDIADNTIDKGAAEIALLNQKNITESAQTQSGVADDDSVIGKQMTLYTNQADGYIQDAKVKTAALWRDVASVQLNINENYTTAGTGFEDAGIKLVMDAARNGIGAVGNVTAPIMTLLGSSSTPQGTPYVDPGVTAIAEDGTVLTASVSGSVDHTTVGSYSLVYTATDSNNLTSNITRTVEVY